MASLVIGEVVREVFGEVLSIVLGELVVEVVGEVTGLAIGEVVGEVIGKVTGPVTGLRTDRPTETQPGPPHTLYCYVRSTS